MPRPFGVIERLGCTKRSSTPSSPPKTRPIHAPLTHIPPTLFMSYKKPRKRPC